MGEEGAGARARERRRVVEGRGEEVQEVHGAGGSGARGWDRELP